MLGAIAGEGGPGDGSPPVRSRGKASLAVPQKLKQFADIVYKF